MTEQRQNLSICGYCGKPFIKKVKTQKYCCLGHNTAYMARDQRRKKLVMEKKNHTHCRYCGHVLTGTSGLVFCSGECRRKWWNRHTRVKKTGTCKFCGKKFPITNMHRRYCSVGCREKYNNRTYRYPQRAVERTKEKYRNDPIFKVRTQMSDRIRKILREKDYKKDTNLTDILGCSIPEFKVYMEGMFEKGMTWDNHGINGWHIDHIKPLATAKTKADVYELWHYTNMQPLWAKDNIGKGAKWEEK